MITSKYLLAIGIAGSLVACTTAGGLTASEQLEIYRANAAAPVDSFRGFRQVDRWTPLGDEALAVWTSPTSGYLLELEKPCTDLKFALSVRLNDDVGTGSDTVTPVGGGASAPAFPCRIREIRPVDYRTVRSAEKRSSGA